MAEDAGISWHVETHKDTERSTDWYWGLGLLAVAGAGLSLFFGNYLLPIILLLGAGSLGVLAARGPREHIVSLTPRGVSLDGTLYRWGNVESFWVEGSDGHRPVGTEAHLIVATKGILHPQLIVPLVDSARAQNVRAYIKRFCREEEQEAHLGHHVAQMLGL